jgi:proteic killer suppression protein
MIQSFKDADTRELFEAGTCRRWASIRVVALRKLDQIEASINLDNLRVPPAQGRPHRTAQHPNQRSIPDLLRLED